VPKDSANEEVKYAKMLDARNITDYYVRVYMVKLREMGLKDFDKNLATLNQCNMNFELAVEKLLQ
jgi:predicted transcriptional regulator